MELKKGSVPVPVIETLDVEVNRKWAEFETLSFSDMSAQSLIGAEAYQSSTPQASQSLVGSQTYHSSPQDDEHTLVTGSQTDSTNSKEAFPPINAQTIQTNRAEALQKEVSG